jgi:hypothetical protein
MGVSRATLVLIAVGLWAAPSAAQPRVGCLHGENETRVQQQRREDATDAADLINRIISRRPRGSAYPTWENLTKSRELDTLRGIAGRRGDLARKMAWGTEQPLPGWLIHYVAAENGYAFSLTDMRDPCQLTLSSDDTGIVIEGRPADARGQVRVVPLDSSQ